MSEKYYHKSKYTESYDISDLWEPSDNRIELLKSRQNSANGPIIKKLKEAKYGQ